MAMRRLFTAALALCLLASVLIGCTSEEPTKTTGTAQTGKEEGTMYLLTMLEEKNDQGEVVERHTYTYNERGLVLTKNVDFNRLTVWNDELGIYEYELHPCDGVVDYQTAFAYDEYGNPTKAFDESYEYTYDSDGRVTAFATTYSDQTISCNKIDYDAAGNVKILQIQSEGAAEPELRYEIEYDEAGCIIQMTRYEQEAKIPYQFEYDAEGRLISWKPVSDYAILGYNSSFTYDKSGRVVNEYGTHGELSYQYEDNMLVAINDERLITQKQDNGALTVQYGDYVLTYTPVVLDEQGMDMARNRWNQVFGRFFSIHGYAGNPLYVHHPVYDLDTVLLLPKELFRF
jgi:YD repeat-containing protein